MSTVQTSSTVTDPYAAINAAASSSTSTTKTEDPQDRFLKLLVTQLKNQDPLNPMDNAEMTSQLAQMSTVTGIEKLNTTLGTLVDSIATSQSMQASEMIGKSVLVKGSQLTLYKSEALAGFNLASAADKVTVNILDSTGKVVQTQDLGAHDAGIYNIAWDGMKEDGTTAADGTYKIEVSATQGTNTVSVDALQVGTVSALVRSKTGFLLDLGSLGRVDFSAVQQVL